MTTEAWKVVVAASADRSLERLPLKIAAAMVEFMLGPLVEEPRRVGHPLQRELTGLWSARRGAYRIVHEVNDLQQIVNVVRIDHRSDVFRLR